MPVHSASMFALYFHRDKKNIYIIIIMCRNFTVRYRFHDGVILNRKALSNKVSNIQRTNRLDSLIIKPWRLQLTFFFLQMVQPVNLLVTQSLICLRCLSIDSLMCHQKKWLLFKAGLKYSNVLTTCFLLIFKSKLI